MAIVNNLFMVGERIKKLRLSKGMSQKDLAEKVNVTQAHISKIERGEREPAYATLDLLAQILGASLSYLLGETPHPYAKGQVTDLAALSARAENDPIAQSVLNLTELTREEKLLLFCFRSLPDEDKRRQALRLIQAL